MIHTFSGCILGSAVECDLDELLATRLVSFLMDHQQSILSVPEYLLNAINDHLQYLRTAQVQRRLLGCMYTTSLGRMNRSWINVMFILSVGLGPHRSKYTVTEDTYS